MKGGWPWRDGKRPETKIEHKTTGQPHLGVSLGGFMLKKTF